MGERLYMRRLIYVPIIHTDPDLGSLVEGIEERARAVVGDNNWEKHKEVVRLYWQEIADYWQGKNVSGFKIFQDGMPVSGVVGKNIVQSLANEGSINHKIIEQLLDKGAELIQTEDPDPLKSINESLEEGETGICFLGAYHQVLPHLPKDIEVITLKDPEKVRAYYQKLTSNQSEGEVDRLGSYLAAPIT